MSGRRLRLGDVGGALRDGVRDQPQRREAGEGGQPVSDRAAVKARRVIIKVCSRMARSRPKEVRKKPSLAETTVVAMAGCGGAPAQ